MTFLILRSGGRVDCTTQYEPTIRSISIRDIALSLSVQVRFLNHLHVSRKTVLTHSWEVARAIKLDGGTPLMCLWGLLHDASETITGDMPGPLKSYLPDLSALEHSLHGQILDLFGIERPLGYQRSQIKRFDHAALVQEVRRECTPVWERWIEEHPPEVDMGQVWRSDDNPVTVPEFIETFFRLLNQYREQI